MKISMNTVVTMNYEIRDVDNNLLESSKEPVTYLHGGYDQIFPKVEEAMHNKNKGDKVEIILEPAEAFGEYDPELVQLEPTSAFPESQLKEGMAFEGEDEKGETFWYVLHAEANAILKTASSTHNCKDSTLYLTMSPCRECSKLILQAGIKRVVYITEYKDLSGIKFLKKAGIETLRITV